MNDTTIEEHSEDIKWDLVADWLSCPNCPSTDVGVRRDSRDGEVTLYCPECHDEALVIPGEAEEVEG